MDASEIPSVVGTPVDIDGPSNSQLCTPDLGTQSRTVAPIAAVPPETLLQIFALLVEGNGSNASSQRCIPLTHVCRSWRELVLATPSLWSKIENQKLPWIISMIARSQMVPLTVRLRGKGSFELIDPIFKHFARIETLQIRDWGEKNWEKLRSCIESETYAGITPRLRSFEVFGIERQHVIPSTMFQHSLQLQNLSLGLLTDVDWTHLPVFPHLTTFKLVSGSSVLQPTWLELAASLNRMPALEHLTLTGPLPNYTNTSDSGFLAHLPFLERIYLGICSLDAATIFLNKFQLSKDMKVFATHEVYSLPDLNVLRHFYNAVHSALPFLASRVECLNIQRDSDTVPFDFSAQKVYIDCYTALPDGFFSENLHYDFFYAPTSEPNIGLQLDFTANTLPTTIIKNALDILPFQHVTHLGLGTYLRCPEIRATLERLPELQAIVVFEEAIAALVEVLLALTLGEADAASTGLAFPMLTHIGLHGKHPPGKLDGQRSYVHGPTWQQLKEFLEHRKARNAEIHSLDIKRFGFVPRDVVEDLKNYVHRVNWDGA